MANETATVAVEETPAQTPEATPAPAPAPTEAAPATEGAGEGETTDEPAKPGASVAETGALVVGATPKWPTDDPQVHDVVRHYTSLEKQMQALRGRVYLMLSKQGNKMHRGIHLYMSSLSVLTFDMEDAVRDGVLILNGQAVVDNDGDIVEP